MSAYIVPVVMLLGTYLLGMWMGIRRERRRRPGGFGQLDPEAEAELDAAKRKAGPR